MILNKGIKTSHSYGIIKSSLNFCSQVLSLGDVNRKTICNLVPNTEYTVKIACKPFWDGFWSDEVETTIKLDDDGKAFCVRLFCVWFFFDTGC